jgi:hypothetical protein
VTSRAIVISPFLPQVVVRVRYPTPSHPETDRKRPPTAAAELLGARTQRFLRRAVGEPHW